MYLPSKHTFIIERLLFFCLIKYPRVKYYTYRFESNRYSVPAGTYSVCKEVNIVVSKHELKVVNGATGEILAAHKICTEKGKLIKNRNHSRDRSKTINQLKQNVLNLLTHNKSNDFIEEICQRYGR